MTTDVEEGDFIFYKDSADSAKFYLAKVLAITD